MPKRILIIHPEGNIHNNPNLFAIVERLCSEGKQVDIYSNLNKRSYQGQICAGAEHKVFTDPGQHELTGFVSLLELPVISEQTIIEFVKNRIPRYDLVIGVDRGIVEAALISMVQGIPLGLISYEIYFASEAGAEFKAPEIQMCKNIQFAVCQDDLRSKNLAIENQIDPAKIIQMPVIGGSFNPSVKSLMLHDTLHIPIDKKIALYAGSLYAWSGTDYLIESAQAWPDDWVLVVHARYRNDAYLADKMINGLQEKVFISYDAVDSVSELGSLLSAVDLGITYYRPNYNSISAGKNIEYIGLASGKTFAYLQHGLPVCVNQIGEMSEIISKNNLGFVYDSSLPLMLNASDAQLRNWRESVHFKVPKLFDFDSWYKPLGEAIDRLLMNGTKISIKADVPTETELPLITVITPIVNNTPLLRATIDSVLGQQYPKLDYQVIDCRPTNSLVDDLGLYANRLDIRKMPVADPAYPAAICQGMEEAKGDIIIWLMPGEVFLPGALLMAAGMFRLHPEAGLYTGNGQLIDASMNLRGRQKEHIRFDYSALLKGDDYLLQPSTFINKNVVPKVGLPDKALRYHMAYDYWLRITSHFPVVTIDEDISASPAGNSLSESLVDFNAWIEKWKVINSRTGLQMTPGLLTGLFESLQTEEVKKQIGFDANEVFTMLKQNFEVNMQAQLHLNGRIPLNNSGISVLRSQLPHFA